MSGTATAGQAACEAWTASHVAHHEGCQIVPWAGLDEAARDDWEAAAEAVRAYWHLPLDDQARQIVR